MPNALAAHARNLVGPLLRSTYRISTVNADAIPPRGPVLILCDWNMPNMSGMEFLEALRESGNVAKFGFVTTESTAEMRARARDAGAAFLIAKPFTAESFEKTLRPIIG